MGEVTRRFLIFGKVQGVFFRHSTRREARRLAIRGSARNMPDGSVEVVAQAQDAAVAELRSWLQRGPQHARVDEIRETPVAEVATLAEGFHIF